MDYRGQTCTLYPAAWLPTAMRPTQFDPRLSANSFCQSLAGVLMAAGLNVVMPTPGAPDAPLVIRPQVLRADPGSQMMRWLFSWFAGYAVFEVGGQVGRTAGPFANFYAKGTRRMGFYGGNSVTLLNDAGKLAGVEAARQILGILAAMY